MIRQWMTFIVILLLTVGVVQSKKSISTSSTTSTSSTITTNPRKELESKSEETGESVEKGTVKDEEDEDNDTTTKKEETTEDEEETTKSVITEPSARDQHQPILHGPVGPEESFAVVDEDTGKTCLAVKLEADLVLKKDLHEQENFSMPENVNYFGTCDEAKGVYNITLEWKFFNLTLTVNKSSLDFQMKSLELKFNRAELFKDSSEESTPVALHANETELEGFSAPINQSLSCTETKIFTLYTEENIFVGWITLKNFRMQAHNVPAEFGPARMCDQPTANPVVQIKYQSDTAPIAVGSTLAILTLGVVIGYAIYRSLTNKKVDYGNIGGE